MEIIPAIDIIGGEYVRLKRGDYSQKRVYGASPLAMAQEIADAGIKRLHLVDLDGAKAKRVVNLKVLEEIAQNTPLIIDVGGGLQREQDFIDVFNAGAHMATVGSLAARNQSLTLQLLATYGKDKLILGADSLEGMIAVSGWQEATSYPLFDFVTSYLKAGFTKVIATDINRDGMLGGSALELYKNLLEYLNNVKLPVELIASGGVNSLDDLRELKEAGLSGAVIGKALYEGVVTLKELALWVV